METNPTTRKSFIRCGTLTIVKALVKEAKRVGYATKITDDFFVECHDLENTTGCNLVFKAIHTRSEMWLITYSTSYWVENLPEGTDAATPTGYQRRLIDIPAKA